ncbi:DUF2892 domain-containing protein [Cupriavidus sp. BIS7]|uniref:YgaP family membrane protein n=1 Tax=Cupriavidus sp. BIS7 TaxID=1217718 RepID=UPI0003172817|nr:DUF2892 domain-containing protein [Cupriavidus sp. BIS7]
MQKNAGSLDRLARIVIGIVLIALAATHQVGIWGWIGVIPLVTGLIGYCPLYRVFGFSTCPITRQGR